MPPSPASGRPAPSRPTEDAADSAEESPTVAPWLAVVTDKVKTMRYGVVQIVVHDSKVVQIERTERTRFEIPQAVGSR